MQTTHAVVTRIHSVWPTERKRGLQDCNLRHQVLHGDRQHGDRYASVHTSLHQKDAHKLGVERVLQCYCECSYGGPDGRRAIANHIQRDSFLVCSNPILAVSARSTCVPSRAGVAVWAAGLARRLPKGSWSRHLLYRAVRRSTPGTRLLAREIVWQWQNGAGTSYHLAVSRFDRTQSSHFQRSLGVAAG